MCRRINNNRFSKMATVVRVKRRRDEDPLEVLLLTSKRQKPDRKIDEGVADGSIENIFKFAGTVTSKDEGVSKRVREAIRKEKLEREYKLPHTGSCSGNYRTQARNKQQQASGKNRFKVSAKHRALQLDELDNITLDDSEKSKREASDVDKHGPQSQGASDGEETKGRALGFVKLNDVSSSDPKSKRKTRQCHLKVESGHANLTTKTSDPKGDNTCKMCGKRVHNSTVTEGAEIREVIHDNKDGKVDTDTDSQDQCKCDLDSEKPEKIDIQKTVELVENAVKKAEENRRLCSGQGDTNVCGPNRSITDGVADASAIVRTDKWLGEGGRYRTSEEGPYALVDMEAEQEPTLESLIKSSSSSQIVCNAEPMVREMVSERGTDDDYVYDLYFNNSRSFDCRLLETDFMLEALRDHPLDERVAVSDDELVYEDDADDENAERNWRNDYPDQDPRYFENEGREYRYGDDMNDHMAFGPDNQLSEWMSSQCNMDAVELSSDDDIERYETQGSSYDAFYRRVCKDLENDSDSDS